MFSAVFKNNISEIERICKPAVSFLQAILEAIIKETLIMPLEAGILMRWGSNIDTLERRKM